MVHPDGWTPSCFAGNSYVTCEVVEVHPLGHKLRPDGGRGPQLKKKWWTTVSNLQRLSSGSIAGLLVGSPRLAKADNTIRHVTTPLEARDVLHASFSSPGLSAPQLH